MTDQASVSLHQPETCWKDEAAKTIGYFARRRIVRVDNSLVWEIREMAQRTGDIVRLSLHHGPEADFHEMIIYHHGSKYYRPKKHERKAKSFHVIEGVTAVISFDDKGEVIDASIIDGKNAHMLRVDPNTYHCEVPLTDYCIFHESTMGPFVRGSDRVYAPFAPDGAADPEGAARFRARLLDLFKPEWPRFT